MAYLKLKNLAIIAVLVCAFSQTVFAASSLLSGPGLTLGVNGHPASTEPYIKTPAKTQIQLINNMGMGIYRIGAFTQSNGTVTVPYLFDPIRKAAAEGKITLLIMLQPRTLDFSKTEAESYALGKKLGSDFAAKYGQYITYYELGNELDNKVLLPNQTGKSQENYDKPKFRVVAAYLKGMDEGIKSQDADAKTMIDAGWLHYAFLRMCDGYGIKFDIVAYHWYSDMEKAALSYDIPDITKKLSALFPNKPIWFTESGSQPKGLPDDEKKQNDFLLSFIKKCRDNPQVKALIFYELLDEAPFKPGREGSYGLTKWFQPYTLLTYKTFASTLAMYAQNIVR